MRYLKTTWIIFVTVCCSVFGEVQTFVYDDVQTFVEKAIPMKITRSSEVVHGRATLMDQSGSDVTVPPSLKSKEDKYPISWEKGKFSKYSVQYPLFDSLTSSFFKKNLEKSGLSYESRESDGNTEVWVISLPESQERALYQQDWVAPSQLSIAELKKIGVKHLRKYFKQFSGQLDYLTEEVDYESINSQSVISEIRLRFARRFHEAIVLGNVSYLYIVMDGRGKFKRAKIKWPVLEQAQVIKGIKSAQSTLDDAKLFCKLGKHTDVWGAPEIVKPVSANITGAARVWIPEKVNGQIYIGPAYSYSVSTITENKDTLHRYVNMPLDIRDSVTQGKFKNVTIGSATQEEKDSVQIAPVIRSVRAR